MRSHKKYEGWFHLLSRVAVTASAASGSVGDPNQLWNGPNVVSRGYSNILGSAICGDELLWSFAQRFATEFLKQPVHCMMVYRLHACVLPPPPPNCHVEILTPDEMILGRLAFGRWLGHVGVVLKSRISALISRNMTVLAFCLFSPPCKDTVRRWPSENEKECPYWTTTSTNQGLILDF